MKYEELKKMLDKLKEIPYPDLIYVDKNPKYANLLYDDLSGELGELSAITQYVYEHMNWYQQEDLNKIMLNIAIEEMRHLNIVGEIIKRSGKTPKYLSSNGTIWTADNVNFETDDIIKTMQYNIQTEQAAIAGYRKAMMHTKNNNIRKVLNRIILDEKNHIKIFESIIKAQ